MIGKVPSLFPLSSVLLCLSRLEASLVVTALFAAGPGYLEVPGINLEKNASQAQK